MIELELHETEAIDDEVLAGSIGPEIDKPCEWIREDHDAAWPRYQIHVVLGAANSIP